MRQRHRHDRQLPPRNEPLSFRQTLESVYRDELRRGAVQTFVDAEGDIVWTQEYFRYRVNGCTNQQAIDRVLSQVLGGPVQALCSGAPTPATPSITGFVTQVSVGDTRSALVRGGRPNAGAGPVVSVPASARVINGGANQVTLTSLTPVDRIVISVETGSSNSSPAITNSPRVAADSFYLLQLPSPQTTIALTIVLPSQISSERFTLEYSAAVGDGPFGTYREQDCEVTTVGTGDVQISVTWDSPADVDLHVIEPNGTEIFFGAPRSSTGGELDLDSNAGCSDGPRAENISWPSGRAPSGTYTVRLSYRSNCGAPETNFVICVNSSDTFEGTFTGSGEVGSLRTITTFTR